MDKYDKIAIYVWTGTCDLTEKCGKFVSLKTEDGENVTGMSHKPNWLALSVVINVYFFYINKEIRTNCGQRINSKF